MPDDDTLNVTQSTVMCSIVQIKEYYQNNNKLNCMNCTHFQWEIAKICYNVAVAIVGKGLHSRHVRVLAWGVVVNPLNLLRCVSMIRFAVHRISSAIFQ